MTATEVWLVVGAIAAGALICVAYYFDVKREDEADDQR